MIQKEKDMIALTRATNSFRNKSLQSGVRNHRCIPVAGEGGREREGGERGDTINACPGRDIGGTKGRVSGHRSNNACPLPLFIRASKQ